VAVFLFFVFYCSYVVPRLLVSEAEKRATSAEHACAEAKAALAKIQNDTCYRPDRHMTQQEKHVILPALTELARNTQPKLKRLLIGSVDGDRESANFARELYELLDAAGWAIDGQYFMPRRKTENDIGYPGTHEGIYFTPTAECTTTPQTRACKEQITLVYKFVTIFRGIGMEPHEGQLDSRDARKNRGGLILWVGYKEVS
jgi:hypothetical protein